jgi:SnoaL-like protein
VETVERFIRALEAQDWETFAATISDDGFERIGPFGERTPKKASYVEFLKQARGALPGYRIELTRVASSNGLAVAELVEIFELEGKHTELPEAWLFDIGPDGLIRRVAIYMQWPERLEEAQRGGGAGPPQ